jgi:hypothetical protein
LIEKGVGVVVGVATVGLLAGLGTSGRVEDALRGYADVIGYFARTGDAVQRIRIHATRLRQLHDRHGRVIDPIRDRQFGDNVQTPRREPRVRQSPHQLASRSLCLTRLSDAPRPRHCHSPSDDPAPPAAPTAQHGPSIVPPHGGQSPPSERSRISSRTWSSRGAAAPLLRWLQSK